MLWTFIPQSPAARTLIEPGLISTYVGNLLRKASLGSVAPVHSP